MNQQTMSIAYYAVIILIFVGFFWFMNRSNKKREREQLLMMDSLQIGDEVVTIGGVIGKISSIKEDSVVIESGSDKSKIRFEKSAIKTVLTVHE
ncbi:MAG: preprotein translocase subunit YajC [Oscillospiraceae bacterium]|nr:preprotein translocase subunit YajC [Oscillospiraceae bacterium]